MRGRKSANQQISATRTAPPQRRHLLSAGVSGVKRISRSNGEVEGPPRSTHQAPQAHTFFRRPRRLSTDRSRSPPTIIRRHVAPYRSCAGIVRRRSANFACAAVSTGRCRIVVLAGSAPKKLFPFQLFKGRTGRATKPPPQLGHTFPKTSSTQVAQKVHS